jgi:hypothetical protein
MTNFELALGREFYDYENEGLPQAWVTFVEAYGLDAYQVYPSGWSPSHTGGSPAKYSSPWCGRGDNAGIAADVRALLQRERSRQLCGLPPSAWYNDYVV